MIFFNPENVVFFLCIPLVALGMIWAYLRRQKRLRQMIASEQWERLVPGRSLKRKLYKSLLLLAGLSLLILCMMRPQYGTKETLLKRQGNEVYIALDTSISMRVTDVKPNRFEKAKQEIQALISLLPEDKIGLIAFSGSAQIHCPLTLDHSAVALFLQDMNVGMLERPGTRVETVLSLLSKQLGNKNGKNTVLVIYTDGETESPQLDAALKPLIKKGVTIYTIGLGTPKGEPIPILNENGSVKEYKRDKENNVVLSKLNEDVLLDISSQSGGQYYASKPQQWTSDAVYKSLAKKEKQSLEERLQKTHYDRYHVLLFLAFLLLLLEFWVSESRRVAQ